MYTFSMLYHSVMSRIWDTRSGDILFNTVKDIVSYFISYMKFSFQKCEKTLKELLWRNVNCRFFFLKCYTGLQTHKSASVCLLCFKQMLILLMLGIKITFYIDNNIPCIFYYWKYYNLIIHCGFPKLVKGKNFYS